MRQKGWESGRGLPQSKTQAWFVAIQDAGGAVYEKINFFRKNAGLGWTSLDLAGLGLTGKGAGIQNPE